MKKFLCLLLFFGSSAYAAAGNKGKGSEIFKGTCSICHGTQGISSSEMYPNLAGQKEGYIKKQLNDIKGGTRKDPIMQPYASRLSEEDINNLAAFLSDLKCSK